MHVTIWTFIGMDVDSRRRLEYEGMDGQGCFDTKISRIDAIVN